MANERARELRKKRTAAERRPWWKLRGLKGAGFKFRQQVPIERYIVDFARLSKNLIAEVDGGAHSTGGPRNGPSDTLYPHPHPLPAKGEGRSSRHGLEQHDPGPVAEMEALHRMHQGTVQ